MDPWQWQKLQQEDVQDAEEFVSQKDTWILDALRGQILSTYTG